MNALAYIGPPSTAQVRPFVTHLTKKKVTKTNFISQSAHEMNKTGRDSKFPLTTLSFLFLTNTSVRTRTSELLEFKRL